MKALSLRQGWAWLITHGPRNGEPWKPVENREWTTDKNHFGPTLIHASAGMTRDEYGECREFIASLIYHGHTALTLERFPKFEALERGGIVGQVEIYAYIRMLAPSGSPERFDIRAQNSNDREQAKTMIQSPWFFGTVGICLRNCRPLPFQPCKGMLGFFTPKL